MNYRQLQLKIDEGLWISLPMTGQQDEWQTIEVPNVLTGSRALNVVLEAEVREGFRPFSGKNKLSRGQGFYPLFVPNQMREVDVIVEPEMEGWFDEKINLKVIQ